MALDVKQLLQMPQAQLDALFTAREAGPIPEGEARGTAIIAPGTEFSKTIAEFINISPGNAKCSTRRTGFWATRSFRPASRRSSARCTKKTNTN
jgi:hypothetical protein